LAHDGRHPAALDSKVDLVESMDKVLTGAEGLANTDHRGG
jgi:hypothetical protein